MSQIMEFRKNNHSLNDSVESSLKAFDLPLKSLQLINKKHVDISVQAALQILFNVGFFW